MADLARLVVSLEAETSRYQRELARAQGQLTRFSRQTESTLGSIAKAFASFAAVAGFGALVKGAIDSADRLSKLSQSTGVTTEALSQLEYAADLSGASSEEFAKALQRLSVNAVDAAENVKGPAAQAFAKFGVAVLDSGGKLKSTEQLLTETSQAFATFADGPAKAAAGAAIFGKGVQDLIPFLNLGEKGIADLRAELDAMGGTVSTKTGKAAEDFNDNLTRLNTSVKGVALTLVADLLPDLVTVSQAILDISRSSDAGSTSAGVLSTAFRGLAAVFASVGTFLGDIQNRIGQFVAVAHSVATLNFGAIPGIFREVSENADKAQERLGKFLVRMVDGDAATTKATASTRAYAAAQEEQKRTLELSRSELDGLVKELEFQAATLSLNTDQIRLYKLQQAGASAEQIGLALSVQKSTEALKRNKEASEKIKSLTDALKDQAATIGFTATQLEVYKLKQAGAGAASIALALRVGAATDALEAQKKMLDDARALTEKVRTPTQILADETARYGELLAHGAITQGTFNAAVADAQQIFADTDGAMKAASATKKHLDELIAATPTAKLEEQRNDMLLLAKAYEDGKFGIMGTTEAIAAFNETALTTLNALPDAFAKNTDRLMELGDEAAKNMQSAFADFLFDPFKNGTDGMIQGFATAMRKMAAEFLAHEAFKKLASLGGGGGGIGGLIGSFLSGGSFASGGVMPAGRVSLVGEQGPELVLPGATSRVLNNRDTTAMLKTPSGGNVTIYQSFAPGTDTRTIDQAAMKVGITTQRSMRRNG